MIPILAIAFAFIACQKEDILVYDSDYPSLNFVKSYFLPGSVDDSDLDTLKINTVYHVGKDEVDFKIPIRLSGSIAD